MQISNQLHGLDFESKIIKENLDYPNSKAKEKDGYLSASDGINYRGFDMQIKSKKVSAAEDLDSLSIEMASAAVFLNKSLFPFCLTVGFYRQVDDSIKEFFTIYEWVITEEQFLKLKGGLSSIVAKDFENKIKSFGKGNHQKARAYAFHENKEIKKQYITSVMLHPKIDAKTQRRLQCSVKISDLIKNCGEPLIYDKENPYFNLSLPYYINSSPRKFNLNVNL